MRRSNGSNHPVARRVAMASMTILATSGIGMVAAPMAFGQIVINGPLVGPVGGSQSSGVTNSGSATANTGGNTAVGNSSDNTATSAGSGGGLINVPINLGAPGNTSDGTGAVSTGPATATGNSTGTGVTQSNASGTQVRSFLAPQSQSAGVHNAGSAVADTGGNTAVGNDSTNTATATQNVSGGLIGIGLNLGGPTNNSTGTATVTSGAAEAAGNQSSTAIDQSGAQGGGRHAGPCATSVPIQHAGVSNQGHAEAHTGNNTAVGNSSTNEATATQNVSGGLLSLGVNLGGPVNNSSGTASVDTGPATAVGNSSETHVTQSQHCPHPVALTTGHPHVTKHPVVHHRVPELKHARKGVLARTGLDTEELGMMAGALLGAGMLLIASQRRRMAARYAAVPLGGTGSGFSSEDWDRPLR